MTPRALFWTFALLNMLAAFLVALAGVYYARKKDLEKHKRLMKASASLVVLFVVAYAIKVLTLGREDLALWDSTAVIILRIHESLVLIFTLTGFYAFRISRKIPGGANSSPPQTVARHRKVGRIAIAAFVLALFTAGLTWNTIIQQERNKAEQASLALESAAAKRNSVNLR